MCGWSKRNTVPPEELEEEVIASGLVRAESCLWIFSAQGDGNDVIVYDLPGPRWKQGRSTAQLPENSCDLRFRASGKAASCPSRISSLPKSPERWMCIGLSCVTIGAQASHETQSLFEAGEYTKYLYLHGLSVETAEALAEYLHKQMREELGIAGEDSPHIRDLFHQKYRGSRYSFGYPACPNLEDQTKLFALLKPEENIGVRLTSGFLLDPEQSTSAIVVHHPAAKYFVV